MTTERIDHAAEAMRCLDIPSHFIRNDGTSPEGGRMVAEAQVHATLALVEQQRIANLIALTGLGGELYLASREAAEALTRRAPDPNNPGDVGRVLRLDIAAALGVDS